jgi:hypothetical protein
MSVKIQSHLHKHSTFAEEGRIQKYLPSKVLQSVKPPKLSVLQQKGAAPFPQAFACWTVLSTLIGVGLGLGLDLWAAGLAIALTASRAVMVKILEKCILS